MKYLYLLLLSLSLFSCIDYAEYDHELREAAEKQDKTIYPLLEIDSNGLVNRNLESATKEYHINKDHYIIYKDSIQILFEDGNFVYSNKNKINNLYFIDVKKYLHQFKTFNIVEINEEPVSKNFKDYMKDYINLYQL